MSTRRIVQRQSLKDKHAALQLFVQSARPFILFTKQLDAAYQHGFDKGYAQAKDEVLAANTPTDDTEGVP